MLLEAMIFIQAVTKLRVQNWLIYFFLLPTIVFYFEYY